MPGLHSGDSSSSSSSSKRTSTTNDVICASTKLACTSAPTVLDLCSSGLRGALCCGGDDGRLELLLVRRLPRPAAAAHVGGIDARVHVAGRLQAVERLPPKPPQILHQWRGNKSPPVPCTHRRSPMKHTM